MICAADGHLHQFGKIVSLMVVKIYCTKIRIIYKTPKIIDEIMVKLIFLCTEKKKTS